MLKTNTCPHSHSTLTQTAAHSTKKKKTRSPTRRWRSADQIIQITSTLLPPSLIVTEHRWQGSRILRENGNCSFQKITTVVATETFVCLCAGAYFTTRTQPHTQKTTKVKFLTSFLSREIKDSLICGEIKERDLNIERLFFFSISLSCRLFNLLCQQLLGSLEDEAAPQFHRVATWWNITADWKLKDWHLGTNPPFLTLTLTPAVVRNTCGIGRLPDQPEV